MKKIKILGLTFLTIYFLFWLLLLSSYQFGFYSISKKISSLYFLPKTAYHYYVNGNIYAQLYLNNDLEKPDLAIENYDKSLKRRYIWQAENNKDFLLRIESINKKNMNNDGGLQKNNKTSEGNTFKRVEYRDKIVDDESLKRYQQKIIQESRELDLYNQY